MGRVDLQHLADDGYVFVAYLPHLNGGARAQAGAVHHVVEETLLCFAGFSYLVPDSVDAALNKNRCY